MTKPKPYPKMPPPPKPPKPPKAAPTPAKVK